MATRIQLCGRLAVLRDGLRLDRKFPGRQGRILFAYLAEHRQQMTSRESLVDALWASEPPAAADTALSALLSKLRRTLGEGWIEGRSRVRLVLPTDTWLDTEVARSSIHDAEAAAIRADWSQAWMSARIAQHITMRPFLDDDDRPWISDRRQALHVDYLRALEVAALSSVTIGGAELDTAERSARTLIQQSPFRESGYRYLMQALASRGNQAQALTVYEELRTILRQQLGTTPSEPTQQLHRRLLN